MKITLATVTAAALAAAIPGIARSQCHTGLTASPPIVLTQPGQAVTVSNALFCSRGMRDGYSGTTSAEVCGITRMPNKGIRLSYDSEFAFAVCHFTCVVG